MNKAVVVVGEASETESEEESPICQETVTAVPSIQGKVVIGEDSESENESAMNLSSLDKLSHLKYEGTNYDSLLHQKLRENNTHFRTILEGFCTSMVNEAAKSLMLTDQNLIKSQVTIQNGVTSLKNLNNNSHLIETKLHSLLSAKFLSNVIIDK